MPIYTPVPRITLRVEIFYQDGEQRKKEVFTSAAEANAFLKNRKLKSVKKKGGDTEFNVFVEFSEDDVGVYIINVD